MRGNYWERFASYHVGYAHARCSRVVYTTPYAGESAFATGFHRPHSTFPYVLRIHGLGFASGEPLAGPTLTPELGQTYGRRPFIPDGKFMPYFSAPTFTESLPGTLWGRANTCEHASPTPGFTNHRDMF